MAYHLQLIGAPIGFNRTSVAFLVQEKTCTKKGQKFNFFYKSFSKISFLSGFHGKSPLLYPHYFSTPNIFYHGQQRSKVNHFGEKVKNHQKLSKKHKFFKNLTSITPYLTGCPNVPTSAWYWILIKKKIFFLMKSGIFWLFFRKSRFFTPPTLVKVQQRGVQSKSAIRKKSFFHRFKAACKKLEKFIGWFRRTFKIFFFGHIWVEPRTRRGPYPCLTW